MPYYNRDPKRDHNFDNHPYTNMKHPPAPTIDTTVIAATIVLTRITIVTLAPSITDITKSYCSNPES